jgi:hypothetical protein
VRATGPLVLNQHGAAHLNYLARIAVGVAQHVCVQDYAWQAVRRDWRQAVSHWIAANRVVLVRQAPRIGLSAFGPVAAQGRAGL